MKSLKARFVLALTLAVSMVVSSSVAAFAADTQPQQISDVEYVSMDLSDFVEAVLIDEDQNVIHLDADDISVNLQQTRSRSTGAKEYVLSYAAGTDKVESNTSTKNGFVVTAYGDVYWTDNPGLEPNILSRVTGGWKCANGSSTVGEKEIFYGIDFLTKRKTSAATFSYSPNTTFSLGVNVGLKTTATIKNSAGKTAVLNLSVRIPYIFN